MLSYKKRLIIVCSVILLFLSSCAVVDKLASKQMKYNVIQGSDYTDFIQSGGKRIGFVSSSTEHVDYYFETEKYTEEQKAEFIHKVETLRTFLENECKVSFKEPLSIYISEKNMLQGANRKVFLNDLNVESTDVAIAFLQSLYGYNANYGLCYGISCYVSEKLYATSLAPSISAKELGQYYSTEANLSLLNLTIPVFQTVYFSEEQNKYAYSTAYHFGKDLIERKGLKYSVNLLENSAKFDVGFDTEYTNEKNIWLKTVGATQKCETPEIPIRYELNLKTGTKIYPYAIYTPSTISYFDSTIEEFK